MVIRKRRLRISIGSPPREFAFRRAECVDPACGVDARDINASKIVIVGEGSVLRGVAYHRKAFRWTPARGSESIEDLLIPEGMDVAAIAGTLRTP